MAALSSSTRLHRRWFLSLSLIAGLAVIALGMLLWQAVELSSLTVVSERVDRWRPLLGGARFALIGLLAVLWSRLPSLRLRAEADREAAGVRWLALRWRVIAWLLAIELVIGQNLLGRFLGQVANSV
jgi:hypothetical protein